MNPTLTLWCRAARAWRPGWNRGRPRARRPPGGSRGAAAAVWTGRWRGCETGPPAGAPGPGTPWPRPLHDTESELDGKAPTQAHLWRERRGADGNSPVSRQRSTYTWAAMRQYMSECCSSVFRAFFPAGRTRGKSQHRCENLSQCEGLKVTMATFCLFFFNKNKQKSKVNRHWTHKCTQKEIEVG